MAAAAYHGSHHVLCKVAAASLVVKKQEPKKIKLNCKTEEERPNVSSDALMGLWHEEAQSSAKIYQLTN